MSGIQSQKWEELSACIKTEQGKDDSYLLGLHNNMYFLILRACNWEEGLVGEVLAA